MSKQQILIPNLNKIMEYIINEEEATPELQIVVMQEESEETEKPSEARTETEQPVDESRKRKRNTEETKAEQREEEEDT